MYPNLLETLDRQATDHVEQGEMESAVRWSLTSLEASRQAVKENGDCVPYLIRALRRLAAVRASLGNRSAALDLLEEAVRVADRTGGVDPLETALIRTEWASLADEDGDWQKASRLLLQALAVLEDMGFDVVEQFALRNNLAMILKREGQFQDAERQYLKAREEVVRFFGSRSAEFAAVCNNLGGLYGEIGRWKASIASHEKALAIWKELKSGPQEIGQSLSNLAVAYQKIRKPGKADELYRKAL
ncbi:MAG: tetratricopeptide repeat protein, partial [Verrucomicrobiota bacterium]